MNFQKQYIKIVDAYTKPFKKDLNVVGITLNGGVSRGTGDMFSEIDLHFYVENKKKTKNFPPKIQGIGNDIGINGVWFDIHVYEIEKEKNQKWNMDRRWDFSHCKIIFQRNNVLTKLKREKVKITEEEKQETGFLAYWSMLLSETFLHRRDLINAHLLINNALDNFVNLYFLKANEPIPYFKWKYYYFQKLKKPSQKIKKAIFEAYKIKEYTEKELEKRTNLIKQFILRDLKIPEERSFRQNKKAMDEFVRSLKKGITYSNPFE